MTTQAERIARELLIIQKVQAFAECDELHRAAFAKWFYEQGTPEAKQRAVIPMAVARWARYEPEIAIEIIYCLLEEINYHTVNAILRAMIETHDIQADDAGGWHIVAPES